MSDTSSQLSPFKCLVNSNFEDGLTIITYIASYYAFSKVHIVEFDMANTMQIRMRVSARLAQMLACVYAYGTQGMMANVISLILTGLARILSLKSPPNHLSDTKLSSTSTIAYIMTNTQKELTPAVDVDIAEDGNVVLIVGTEERRLRVSSSSLTNVSKVFRTMFGPHFSEGQNLGDISRGPKEVHMPEDNADAIEIICSLMHFRGVPEEIEPDLMLQVAVATDKFDCGIVLQHASKL
jgi:hypothetical protein